MKKICNLPRDLAEEVLSRVPVTSLRRVRLTCREWNTLSKDMSFAKKHMAQEKLAATAEGKGIMVVMMDSRVYLMRFNLSNNVDESCIKSEAKLIGPDSSDLIDVCKIYYCDGLLLCLRKDNPRLVVWNPYWGQTRWIKRPKHGIYRLGSYAYAFGYDKSSNSHKILRFNIMDFIIYKLNSDSWRVLDVSPRDWKMIYYKRGVSLKGNTYLFAMKSREYVLSLICFDFTRETFGPPLPLLFEAGSDDTVCLSSVREEQLAVLFQPPGTLEIEIWVTTKIEPDTVSWSSKVFLSANIKQIIHPHWQFHTAPSFFIDEEKKVAVVSGRYEDIQNQNRNVAYIIGVDGSLKQADVGVSADSNCKVLGCTYVPSLVKLN